MDPRKVLSFLAFAVLCVNTFPTEHIDSPPTCGYESCPKGIPGMLNVHLIPHTHDDVGWLKTVDQYYFGAKPEIQNAGVQYILDTVIQTLLHDPNKKFIYVETAFFWKWWMRQHDTLRHQVKKLINSGQLEVIGGGWSMNDEAVTNYISTIDQMTWGFRKWNDTFGDCARPKIGWQIDPFGHSRDMASTFSLLGFDGLFIGRLDYRDKSARLQSKAAEMVWKASPNLGKKSWLFTGILYNNYAPPPGFCFDLLCNDEPIIDDKHSPDYNVDKKVKEFISYAENQSLSYSTNNIIMTMGEDFNYQDANSWFTNMDRLIRYVNEEQAKGSKVNVFYSTPSCYLKSLNDANMTWSSKEDDFFPYASDPHTYWTGYYTSRPTLKYFERLGNNYLQVCKQLYSLADLGPEDMVDLDAMREAMGIMQHHDAITGTERQLVAFDYARILSNGFKECEAVTSAAINKLMNQPSLQNNEHVEEAPTLDITSCLLSNISQCNISESSEPFIVTVYNPLSRVSDKYVRIPILGSSYTVKDSAAISGPEIQVQLVPIQQELQNIPGRESKASYEMVFKAADLPPLGFRSYYISRANYVMPEGEVTQLPGNIKYKSKKFKNSVKDTVVVGKGAVTFGLGTESGLMEWVESKGVRIKVKQEFLYYEAMQGNNKEFKNRSSGAYVFRPNGTVPMQISSGAVTSTVYSGVNVDEVHQKVSDWVSQVIRVYKDENHIEFNWLVGPIPIDNGVGKEVISRFTTEIKNNGVFYTDSNGREMLHRVRRTANSGLRDEQDPIVEPIGGNYYPVTSRIRISGPGTKTSLMLSVLTDRAQGGSSINDGEIELMVHRRLLRDDAFGVGEALNETAFGTGLIARGQHFLVFGPMAMDEPVSPVYAMERELAERKLLSPWVFLAKAPKSFESWTQNSLTKFQGVQSVLPPNVHILTLEPWKGRSFLIRLEHFYEKNEDNTLSQPVTVNLQDMFGPRKLASIRETTLGANQWVEQSKKLVWRTETNHLDDGGSGIEISSERIFSQEELDPTKILMNPMDIRTFVIEFA